MKKTLILAACAFLSSFLGFTLGLSGQQISTLFIFSLAIFGTLFFWDLRLTFVFLGSGILFLTRSINLDTFIRYASFDVIIFLIGMMIIVAMMKDAGVFRWLVGVILSPKKITGVRLFTVLMLVSASLSGLMGEATSIIVMVAVILEIAALLKVNPVPLVISAVLSTNVGSAATLLGNPIGVLIALRGGLSFEDFLVHAFPLSVLLLLVTIILSIFWYRGFVQELSLALVSYKKNSSEVNCFKMDLNALVSLLIFMFTILSIAMHRRLEVFFGLDQNELLIVLPVIFAAVAMAYRQKRAQYYIAHDIEWASLLFFIFLFALTGALQASGISDIFARSIMRAGADNTAFLGGIFLFTSAGLSSVLDNTVVVSSYIPVIQSLGSLNVNLNPLWWCILFGACLGGNITLIGSTANIVAVGLLEKEKGIKISFAEWLKIGLFIGVTTSVLAYVAITILPFYGR